MAKASKKSAKQQKVTVPAGFRPVSGQFTDTWKPAENKEHPRELIGIWGKVRIINIRRGRGTQEQKVCTVECQDGTVWTIWQSTYLQPLFEEAEQGDTVYIRYDGLGEQKRPDENPPMLFTTAISDDKKPF